MMGIDFWNFVFVPSDAMCFDYGLKATVAQNRTLARMMMNSARLEPGIALTELCVCPLT